MPSGKGLWRSLCFHYFAAAQLRVDFVAVAVVAAAAVAEELVDLVGALWALVEALWALDALVSDLQVD